MNLREPSLPPGWYPQTANEIKRFLSPFAAAGESRAAIAPHAGWYYSGRVAARSVSALDRTAETVVVLGGHLSAGMPPLFAMEEGVRSPLAVMPVDIQFRDALRAELGGAADRYRDNTVEVLLPMVHFFFPKAALLWLRLPSELASFKAGRLIAEIAGQLRRNAVVLASADLTHYGANYGFSPRGGGAAALEWVKTVNDRDFIKAVEGGVPEEALERSQRDLSCCSAGAVLGAMGFAQASGLGPARLLEYATSADASAVEGRTGPASPPDSFVGYAAFAFGKSAKAR